MLFWTIVKEIELRKIKKAQKDLYDAKRMLEACKFEDYRDLYEQACDCQDRLLKLEAEYYELLRLVKVK